MFFSYHEETEQHTESSLTVPDPAFPLTVTLADSPKTVPLGIHISHS
jgi:hypothetical protein